MASSASQNDGEGLVRFDRFVEAALYDPDSGFFATGGGAGRGGADFLTSPEVGPLFGAVVARWLDARWHELGRPDPFVVVEAAAGRGALALAVLAASPACAGALRYLCVERSAALRDRQREHLPIRSPLEVVDGSLPGPLVGQLAELPDGPFDGVVIANELLDNLAFRLLERTAAGWAEVHVDASSAPGGAAAGTVPGGELVEVLVPADADTAARADRLAPAAASRRPDPAAGRGLRLVGPGPGRRRSRLGPRDRLRGRDPVAGGPAGGGVAAHLPGPQPWWAADRVARQPGHHV